MAESIICKHCGTPITGGPFSEVSEEYITCPQCGKKERRSSVQKERNYSLQPKIGELILAGDSAQLVVTPYPEILLGIAKKLIDDGIFSVAVVVAHMACEISTESALSRVIKKRNVDYLEEFFEKSSLTYNLGNDRIQILYNSVTGDQIQDQPFWGNFKTSADLRNKIVHKGKTGKKEEAEKSLKTARDLVAYLGKNQYNF